MSTEDTYKTAITLALHLNLNDLEDIFNHYIKDQRPIKILSDHVAMFIDKIRVLSGKLQLYGTQYKVDKEMNAELLPLYDQINIDKIRQEAGLQPLAEYMKSVKQAFKKKIS